MRLHPLRCEVARGPGPAPALTGRNTVTGRIWSRIAFWGLWAARIKSTSAWDLSQISRSSSRVMTFEILPSVQKPSGHGHSREARRPRGTSGGSRWRLPAARPRHRCSPVHLCNSQRDCRSPFEGRGLFGRLRLSDTRNIIACPTQAECGRISKVMDFSLPTSWCRRVTNSSSDRFLSVFNFFIVLRSAQTR